MNKSISICHGLEDLLANIHHARSQGDLGRLALLAYCDLRGWAKQAGETAIAELSSELFVQHPYPNRDEFLDKVDALIAALERIQFEPDYVGTLPRYQLLTSLARL